jgi:hypothetical protein
MAEIISNWNLHHTVTSVNIDFIKKLENTKIVDRALSAIRSWSRARKEIDNCQGQYPTVEKAVLGYSFS